MKVRQNTRNYVRFIVVLFAFCAIVSSCSQDDDVYERGNSLELYDGKKVGDLVINKLSVLLSPSSIDKIVTLKENLVIFESEPEQSSEFIPGAILVGVKANGSVIENIMSKVISVDVVNGEWRVQTESVKLEEFILSGTISGSVYPMLYKEDGAGNSKRLSTLMMMQDVEGFPSFEYLNNSVNVQKAAVEFPRIEYSEVFSIGLPVEYVDLQSSMSLSAGFTPVFDYKIKFGIKGIEEFDITLSAQEILLDSHLKASAGLKYELSTADLYSVPIVPIVLGPTGLVLSPTVSVGPYAYVKAGTSLDVKLFHVDGDILYELTDPLKLPKFNLHADPYDWSNIQWGGVGLDAEAGINLNTGISLTFITINIASVDVSSKLGVGLGVNMPDVSRVNLKINGSLSADARLRLGVLPLGVERVFPLASWKPVIYEKEFVTGL